MTGYISPRTDAGKSFRQSRREGCGLECHRASVRGEQIGEAFLGGRRAPLREEVGFHARAGRHAAADRAMSASRSSSVMRFHQPSSS